MLQPAGVPLSIETAYEAYCLDCLALGEAPLRLVDMLGMASLLASAEPLAQSVEVGSRLN